MLIKVKTALELTTNTNKTLEKELVKRKEMFKKTKQENY